MKKNILFFMLGLIIAGSVGVYAAIKIQADEIEYKDGTVEDALNDLYSKANNSKKTCLYVSGTKGAVSSKYLCDPGDGVARYFYILKADGNQVQLIMERNLSDEVGSHVIMSWNDAMTFFDEGHDGYSTKQAWKNVSSIDLPSAQEIADVGNIPNWDINTVEYKSVSTDNYYYFGGNQSNASSYMWLYNYSRGNSMPDDDGYPWGYWTQDLVVNSNGDRIWVVHKNGMLFPTSQSNVSYGVRPVITISTSQLSN